jgi:Ca2+-binding RTX toxin-like protein
MVTQILAGLLLAMAPATVGGDPGTRGGAMCRGEAAVVADEAEWQGTFDRDVVVASSAVVDSISLLDGDDLVCVYSDPRAPYHGLTVHGGLGADTMITYGGANDLYGDEGADIFYLGGADEAVYGGTGNDHVWGLGASHVVAHGEGGTDMLQGSDTNDSLSGGDDGDLIIGAGGDDTLDGEGGNDDIQGNAGADDLDGGAGADTCSDSQGSTFTSCETTAFTPPFPVKGN